MSDTKPTSRRLIKQVAVPDENMRALIRRLTVGTETGTVKWAVQRPHAYVLEGAAAKVTVQSGADDDSHPYYFEVRNPDGFVVGSGDTVPGAGYETWETEIENLYQAARNNALGVDKTVRDLAAELKLPSDPDIPF
jgi:hypothetical protein